VENGVGVVGSEKHDEGEEHAAADAASERLDELEEKKVVSKSIRRMKIKNLFHKNGNNYNKTKTP
jgi:hypothetical protein